MQRIVLYLTYTLSTAVLLFGLLITIDGLTDSLIPVDVAVVFGNTVNTDGSVSKRLQARLDKALELYQKGYFTRIIVSGGTGVEGFDEALVMKNYLVKHNINSNFIDVDSQGINSFATAKNTVLLREHANSSVMVISQYFHITRCRIAFNKVGIYNVQSAHANYFEWRDIYSLFREVIAIPVYLIKPRRGI